MKVLLRDVNKSQSSSSKSPVVVDVVLDETVLHYRLGDFETNLGDIEDQKCYVCIWRKGEIISSFLYKNGSSEVNIFMAYGSPYFVAHDMTLTQIIDEVSNMRLNEKGYHICVSDATGMIPSVLLNRGISVYVDKNEIVFSHHDEADAMELRLSL